MLNKLFDLCHILNKKVSINEVVAADASWMGVSTGGGYDLYFMNGKVVKVNHLENQIYVLKQKLLKYQTEEAISSVNWWKED